MPIPHDGQMRRLYISGFFGILLGSACARLSPACVVHEVSATHSVVFSDVCAPVQHLYGAGL